MNRAYVYDTESAAISGLRSRGYVYDFNLSSELLICVQNNTQYGPDDFLIMEVHRFEGDTDPGDESIVLAIQTKDQAILGVLISAYGTYAEEWSRPLLEKLN